MLQQNSEGKDMSQGAFYLWGKLKRLKISAWKSLPNTANNQAQVESGGEYSQHMKQLYSKETCSVFFCFSLIKMSSEGLADSLAHGNISCINWSLIQVLYLD